MSISPIITFKAGTCDVDTDVSPPKIKARPTPGYVYLFEEDELLHLCWRPRSASMSSPELSLVMLPNDGRFVPYKDAEKSTETSIKSPTNGRIFVLKFQSSTQRYFFWLQSKSQHPQGDSAWFSQRDLKLGDIVDRLLQGDEVDARFEFENVMPEAGGDQGGDAEMADAPPDASGQDQGNTSEPGQQGGSNTSNQAGPGENRSAPTGGNDPPTDDAAAAVQNFLRSMQGNPALQGSSSQGQQAQGKIFTTLPDLLPPSTTIPYLDSLATPEIDNLLSHIPPVLLLLSQQADTKVATAEPNAETTKAAIEAMSLEQKKEVLRKVLRSPQFTQSLNSMTTALRDGGLPMISDALNIPVENGGRIRGGNVPLGGGDAVEAFMEGVKASAKKGGKEEGQMETD